MIARWRHWGGVLAAWLALAGPVMAGDLDGLFPKDVDVGLILEEARLPPPVQAAMGTVRLDHKGRMTLLQDQSVAVLGEKRVVELPLAVGGGLDDYTWMPDGALLGIYGNRLGFPGRDGLTRLIDLPETGMHLRTASPTQVYLFGGETREQRLHAYLLDRDKGLLHLAEMAYPITAIAGDGNLHFIAIGRSILAVAPSQPVGLVYRPPVEVRHLVYAKPYGLIYATADSVGFILGPGKGYTFLKAANVRPMIHDDVLYLVIPGQGVLRASPLSAFQEMAEDLAGAD